MGILEYVLLKVEILIFPIDFYVLDMRETIDEELIMLVGEVNFVHISCTSRLQ